MSVKPEYGYAKTVFYLNRLGAALVDLDDAQALAAGPIKNLKWFKQISKNAKKIALDETYFFKLVGFIGWYTPEIPILQSWHCMPPLAGLGRQALM